MVDWTVFDESLRADDLCKNKKMLLVTLLKILGYSTQLERLWEFEDSDWVAVKNITADEIRAAMNKVLQTEFVFDSNCELQKMKKNFLDVPDVSSTQFKDSTDKNWLMVSIYMRQMFVFGLLRNNILISQKYVTIAKDKLKDISNGWTQKKGFLEGAYKILLFRYVRFINGQIVVPKEDAEESEQAGQESILITVDNTTKDINPQLASDLTVQQQAAAQSLHDVSESNEAGLQAETTDICSDLESICLSSQPLPSQIDTATEESLNSAQGQEQEKEINPELENESNQLREKVANLHFEELDEIKRYYSQDIEASLDRLVKKFVENSKANKLSTKLEPDYIFTQNGTETHLFLDDETRLEILIQKFLKFRLLIMRLNYQIQSTAQEV